MPAARKGVLESKVAIITGAASGIGREVALHFAEEGARVLVVDVNQAGGEACIQEISDMGGEANFHPCDLEDPQAVERVIPEALERWGSIDILCNNAAMNFGGTPIEGVSDAHLYRLLNVNLLAAFRLCRAAVVPMREQGGGVIINMCSVQAHNPLEGAPVYAMTKGGLISLTRQIAVEYGRFNIRCNTISPGTIETPMLSRAITEVDPKVVDGWVRMHPLRRFGTPREVSSAAVFLAGSGGGFANGADFRIDGGSTVLPGSAQ